MQVIDPAITKAKFEEEIKSFEERIDFQRKRGVYVLKVGYPNLYLTFCAPQLKPPVVAFAVKINYDNYDLEPLSIRFVNPFTLDLMTEIPVAMLRNITPMHGAMQWQHLAMKQQVGLPFICMPGIREYHEHPAHTGDSWLLHRNKAGEGTLGFLVDKLYEYGISAINSFQITVNSAQLAVDQNKIPL